jgi:ABC-type uncharacterized transport system YnjBCD substrate-binding protein
MDSKAVQISIEISKIVRDRVDWQAELTKQRAAIDQTEVRLDTDFNRDLRAILEAPRNASGLVEKK